MAGVGVRVTAEGPGRPLPATLAGGAGVDDGTDGTDWEDGAGPPGGIPGAVGGAIEALDAEDLIRIAFDEAGHTYSIRWIRPNLHRWFGATNGAYEFVRSPDPDAKAVCMAIRAACAVLPATADVAVRQLQARLERE